MFPSHVGQMYRSFVIITKMIGRAFVERRVLPDHRSVTDCAQEDFL
jgi:hypothetical protein